MADIPIVNIEPEYDPYWFSPPQRVAELYKVPAAYSLNPFTRVVEAMHSVKCPSCSFEMLYWIPMNMAKDDIVQLPCASCLAIPIFITTFLKYESKED